MYFLSFFFFFKTFDLNNILSSVSQPAYCCLYLQHELFNVFVWWQLLDLPFKVRDIWSRCFLIAFFSILYKTTLSSERLPMLRGLPEVQVLRAFVSIMRSHMYILIIPLPCIAGFPVSDGTVVSGIPLVIVYLRARKTLPAFPHRSCTPLSLLPFDRGVTPVSTVLHVAMMTFPFVIGNSFVSNWQKTKIFLNIFWAYNVCFSCNNLKKKSILTYHHAINNIIIFYVKKFYSSNNLFGGI